MIGYLRGKVIDSLGGSVLVDVGGVGYRVAIGSSKAQKLKSSEEVELYVHTHVREDQISLYGFESKKALGLFELLISVSGVGPKVGMAVIGHGSAEKILEAISKADVGFFTGVSGIGKKGAQKIIIELKNKVGGVEELDLEADGGDDLVEALVGMGFDRGKVVEVLRGMEDGLSEDRRLKLAIRELSGK